MKVTKLALGITAIMLLGSCGGGSSSATTTGGAGETITINVWSDKSEQPVIQAIVDEFNKTSATKINVNLTAVAEGDAGTTLASDPKMKNYPSLLAIADDHLNDLVTKSIVAALPDRYASIVRTSDTESAVTAATNGGKVYGFPVQADNGFYLVYDGDELTDAQAGKLEDIISVIQQKNKTFYFDLSNGWYAPSVLFAQGVAGPNSLSYHPNADGDIVYDIAWDTDECARACEYVSGLLAPAYASKNLINGDDSAIDAGFADGKMIAAVTGTWKTDVISAAINNPKFAKMPTYTYGNGVHQMGSFTGTKMYVVNSYATEKEQSAAFTLAELLTNKSGQLRRFATRGALPCNKEALTDKAYLDNVADDAKALNEQNAYAAIQATSAEGRYWSVGGDIGSKILNGITGSWKEYLKDQCDILRAPAA